MKKRASLGDTDGEETVTTASSMQQYVISKPVPQDKSDVLQACVEFVANDMRPMFVVDGSGFQNLVQTIMKVARRKKCAISAKSLLPSRSTLSRRVSTSAEEIRNEFAKELQELVKCNAVSFTTDLWQESHKKMPCVGVTAHYPDKNGTMIARALGCDHFEGLLGIEDVKESGTAAHDHENVRDSISAVLEKYGHPRPEWEARRAVMAPAVTSDSASNMLKATAAVGLPCFGHKADTCFGDMLKGAKGNCSKFSRMHGSIKSVTKFFKQSNLNAMLPVTLKQCGNTRMMYEHKCYESLYASFDKVKKALEERGELHRLARVSKRDMEPVMNLFKTWWRAKQYLEVSLEPTMHRICPVLERLLQASKKALGDDSTVAALKANAITALERKYLPCITKAHWAAVLFTPGMRKLSLTQFPEIRRRQISAYFKAVSNCAPGADEKV